MKKIVALLAGAMLMMATSAMALTYYTPTMSDLAGWTNVGVSNPDLNTFGKEVTTTGVKFTGNMYGQFGTSGEPSMGYVDIGKNFSSALNLSAFSTFDLKVANVNGSSWNYYLYMMDNMGFTATSNNTSILNGTSANLSLDFASFAGLDLTDIASLGLHISQIVPISNPVFADRTFETVVAPVPEPGTMVLLGAGLLGLAVYGKRRMNKEA